ncbi:MAG: nitric oxide reductase transcriptional regulator NorR, partial [Polyangiaceae bacterium]|nr:nitric oxide reductase transcriptional regulator NorR [Polyangiaceae bacterium]
YVVQDHPRLALLCAADEPVRFSPDMPLPDPFDGLLSVDPTSLAQVHACLGFPLRVDGELVGLLTADARDPHAFDAVDAELLAWVGALAGAAVRTNQLIEALEHSAERLGMVADSLRRSTDSTRGAHLVGASPAMERLRGEIALVAPTDFTVLITGETGVGKELVARALHAESKRAAEPLIYVNCAALPESMVESELFGHVRGAFTGAESHRLGKLEVADGGTLFLDEIGELPPAVQPKLLRALQNGEVQRVGADRAHRIDVRVLAATNRDLEQEVAEGRFRADLFHRLNVFRIAVPPLRDRPSDVPRLVGSFCEDLRVRLGTGPVRVSQAALHALCAHGWPGNVRELENAVFRAVLVAAKGVPRGEPIVVAPLHLGAEVRAPSRFPPPTPVAPRPSSDAEPSSLNLRDRLEACKRETIERA